MVLPMNAAVIHRGKEVGGSTRGDRRVHLCGFLKGTEHPLSPPPPPPPSEGRPPPHRAGGGPHQSEGSTPSHHHPRGIRPFTVALPNPSANPGRAFSITPAN